MIIPSVNSKQSQRSLTASIKKSKNNYTELQEESYKKQLLQFDFFKNHLSPDTSPKNVFASLSKYVKITQTGIDETIASMNNHTTTVFFIIKGEVGGYNQLPEQLLDNMIPLKIYGEGQVIGYTGDRNQFTLKTLTTCVIGQIQKILMKNILIKQVQYETRNDVTFFFSHSFFKGWKRARIENMIFSINKKELKKGDHLTVQGGPFKKIFIVRKGNVKVMFSKKQNYHSEYDMEFYQMLSDPSDRFSTQRKFELMPSYQEKELFQLFIVTNGDVIGDFEIKNKRQTYYFTSICEVDNTIVYEIDAETFKALIPDKYMDYLKKMLVPKEDLFRERFNSIIHSPIKRFKSKYIMKILDKIPPTEVLPTKMSYSQAHFKVKIQNIKNMRNFNSFHSTSKGRGSQIRSQSITNECNNSDYKSRNQPEMHTLGSNVKTNNTVMKTFDSVKTISKKRNSRVNMFKTDIPSNRTMRFRDTSGENTLWHNTNEEDKTRRAIVNNNNESNAKAVYPKCFSITKRLFMKQNPHIIKDKVISTFRRGHSKE